MLTLKGVDNTYCVSFQSIFFCPLALINKVVDIDMINNDYEGKKNYFVAIGKCIYMNIIAALIHDQCTECSSNGVLGLFHVNWKHG